MNAKTGTFESKTWRLSLAKEIFDVASLLWFFQAMFVKGSRFQKALSLLKIEPDEVEGVSRALGERKIKRQSHSIAPNPDCDDSWTARQVLQTFIWVHRGFGDGGGRRVAEILDMARLINANAMDLYEAGREFAQFGDMSTQDWQRLLDSGATSFGNAGGGRWDHLLFERHVRGRTTRVAA